VRTIFQLIRSIIFIILMYVMLFVIAVSFAPLVIVRRSVAITAAHTYCRWVRWSAAVLVGLKSEIRGEAPTDEVLVVAKHQSFFDIIMIFSAMPRPKFIMKKEINRTPIVGFYAKRMGCVSVDRGKGGRAIKEMVRAVKESGKLMPGQLIIFPQGTRVAPDVYLPYKIGSGVLYKELGQDCVPVATNVGVFWPRHSLMRKPGLAVVEFLPRIKSGFKTPDFMEQLETSVETASDKLMLAAGRDVSIKRKLPKR
jgi:1-acyl-sn-glycerol-3-phosphate acyltransferase